MRYFIVVPQIGGTVRATKIGRSIFSQRQKWAGYVQKDEIATVQTDKLMDTAINFYKTVREMF